MFLFFKKNSFPKTNLYLIKGVLYVILMHLFISNDVYFIMVYLFISKAVLFHNNIYVFIQYFI